MREKCACKEYDFEFDLTSEEIVCPKCGKEYFVFMDMDDNDNFYYDLIPKANDKK